ncbi:hypothetical protein [Flavivirga spongiicola]|uniref:Leucine-rich repeat domain-containing protein n=1 Tax=Flavivirga spongiicola TaxID=421621 RepID=A0ABU7XWE2_9FLAO|nr:hypothetical protein [Flavivirga sp. MEBiC05379]MDO5979261.1 hypothetical protein [Flavivirga sp. MEBiC05379]
MEPTYVIYIISIIFTGIGLWILFYVFKKWNPNYVPRKITAKIIRNLFGSKGSRIFSGIMGTIILIFGIGLFYLESTRESRHLSNKEKTYIKTDNIQITQHSDNSILHTTLKIEQQKISRIGKDHLKNYKTISFDGNGLENIPNIIWDMTNLRILDLSNNELTEIHQYKDKIQKFEELNLIILDNNPMDSLYVKKINQEFFYDQIQYKGILN